jgi:hypothetical protein
MGIYVLLYEGSEKPKLSVSFKNKITVLAFRLEG